jgi:hypothetical protein
MAGERVVTLYTREHCGLCEVARAYLDAFARELRFSIEEVDIDTDARLKERYGERIPVVAVAGRDIASAPIRRGELEDALTDAFGDR